jgi:hypothetical protein
VGWCFEDVLVALSRRRLGWCLRERGMVMRSWIITERGFLSELERRWGDMVM